MKAQQTEPAAKPRSIDLLAPHEREALLRAASDLQSLVREFDALYDRYGKFVVRMRKSFPSIKSIRYEKISFDSNAFLKLKPAEIADELATELLGQVAQERREVER